MYKPEFKDQHKSLTELVWLIAWEKHNKNQKRQNEGNDGINRKVVQMKAVDTENIIHNRQRLRFLAIINISWSLYF